LPEKQIDQILSLTKKAKEFMPYFELYLQEQLEGANNARRKKGNP